MAVGYEVQTSVQRMERLYEMLGARVNESVGVGEDTCGPVGSRCERGPVLLREAGQAQGVLESGGGGVREQATATVTS
jgi:hypothetical protein